MNSRFTGRLAAMSRALRLRRRVALGVQGQLDARERAQAVGPEDEVRRHVRRPEVQVLGHWAGERGQEVPSKSGLLAFV